MMFPKIAVHLDYLIARNAFPELAVLNEVCNFTFYISLMCNVSTAMTLISDITPQCESSFH